MKHLKYIALFVGLALFVSCGETDVEGDANFVGKGEDDKIFFPMNGDLNFVAYYPYTSTMSGFDYAIAAGTDPLYSTIATGYNKNNTTVGLRFYHMLSKMRLVMQLSKSVTAFDELEVSIENVSTSGVFNVATKEVTRAAATTIKLDFDIADDKKTAWIEQLVMPGQNLKDVRFVFRINGSNYTWWPTESMPLESNKEFTYKLELNEELMIVEVGVATISEWGEGFTADDYEGIRPNATYPK